jgi:hypothetical protein
MLKCNEVLKCRSVEVLKCGREMVVVEERESVGIKIEECWV